MTLKRLRKLRAMSQDELAEASGVGRATISRLERGKGSAHGRTIRALAETLGIEPSELISEREFPG